MINVYEIVTARMIEMIERDGLLPWQKPWTSQAAGSQAPRNLRSGKAYRGMNFVILSMAGYSSPWFVTFKQAQELGGSVRKGEKGLPVVFWKFGTREVENPTTKELENERTALCRYYTVFNIAQCEGLTAPAADDAIAPTVEPIEACESIVAKYSGRPTMRVGSQASYTPSLDYVTMPARETFIGGDEYYSTLFHELTHSTGHPNRLNRSGIAHVERFGSESYSREELVAEMGAAFLCAEAGIANAAVTRNSAAYLKNWLQVIKADPKALVIAAQQAQKAADMIIGRQADQAPTPKKLEQMTAAEIRAKLAEMDQARAAAA